MEVLDLFNHRGFQVHGTEAVNLAGNIMAVDRIDKADIADLGTDLDCLGLTLDLQVFHHRYGVTIGKYVANRILDHSFLRLFDFGDLGRPLVGTFGANQKGAHLVGVGT